MTHRRPLLRKFAATQANMEAVTFLYQYRLLAQLSEMTACYLPKLIPGGKWTLETPLASVDIIIVGSGANGRSEFYQAVRDEDLPRVEANPRFPMLVFCNDDDRGQSYRFSRMGFIEISLE